MPSTWNLEETEPIGSVVARISYFDRDYDNVTFSIVPPIFGIDGSSFFKIDNSQRVVLAKSLKGKVCLFLEYLK